MAHTQQLSQNPITNPGMLKRMQEKGLLEIISDHSIRVKVPEPFEYKGHRYQTPNADPNSLYLILELK